MDAAEKYEKRYLAVLRKAENAYLKLSELDEWAAAKGISFNFARAFPYDGEGPPPPPENYFVSYLLLALSVAEVFRKNASDTSIRGYAARMGSLEADRDAAWAAMVAEIDMRVLRAVFDGDLTLYDSACFPIDVTGERKNYEVFPEAYMWFEFRHSKTPAPLMVGHRMTRLDKWLERATWTPWEAALLVTGIDPASYLESTYGKNIPHATGLCGGRLVGEEDFADAKSVLNEWERQVDPPAKVTAADFMRWCAAKGINTDWLRTVAIVPEVPEAAHNPVIQEPIKFVSLHDLVTLISNRHGGSLSRAAEEIHRAAQSGAFGLFEKQITGYRPCAGDRDAIRTVAEELSALILHNRFLSRAAGGLAEPCHALGFALDELAEPLNLILPATPVEPETTKAEPSVPMDETPEQYRARVLAVVEKHAGNQTAAAKELGISRQRVGQLITPTSQSGPTRINPNDPFNRTPATRKNRA